MKEETKSLCAAAPQSISLRSPGAGPDPHHWLYKAGYEQGWQDAYANALRAATGILASHSHNVGDDECEAMSPYAPLTREMLDEAAKAIKKGYRRPQVEVVTPCACTQYGLMAECEWAGICQRIPGFPQ